MRNQQPPSGYHPRFPGGTAAGARMLRPLGQLQPWATPRMSWIGTICFFALVLCTLGSLNGIALLAFGIVRFFSPLMLGLCITILLVLRLAMIRSLGTAGLWYVGFLLSYLAISLFNGFSDSSLYLLQYHITAAMVMVCCAMGARHVALATSPRTVLRIAFIIALFPVVYAILGTIFPGRFYPYGKAKLLERAAGSFGNANATGAVICLAVAIGFGCLLFEKRRLYIMLGIGMSAIACMLTFSRASIIMLLGVAFVQIFISPLIKRKSMALAMILAVGGVFWFLAAGVNLLTAATSEQMHRINSLWNIFSGSTSSEDTGGRLILIQAALEEWTENPILGRGFGSFRQLEVTGGGPHNVFLLVLGEGGLIPFFALIAFCGVFLHQAWICKVPGVRVASLSCLMVFLGFCMTNHGVAYSQSVWTAMGIMCGLMAAAKETTGHRELPQAALAQPLRRP